MNKLLTGFIDHMFVEMDYLSEYLILSLDSSLIDLNIVKERGVFEMLLDAEFTDTQLLDKSVFFPGEILLHLIIIIMILKV